MSPSPQHRATASQSSISSPTLIPTSLSRKPLHDQSDTQTNRATAPTIRIVEDNAVYSKFPIPSEPSQILPPPRHAPGFAFEQPASRVSSGSKVANVIAKFEASKSVEPPPPLQLRKRAPRYSVSTSNSEAETLVASLFSPPSSARYSRERFSQGSTSTLPSSPQLEPADFEKGLEVLEEESSLSSPRKSTIRAVPPSSSGGESLASRNRASSQAASDASFASNTLLASITQASNDGDSTHFSRPLSKGHRQTPSSGSETGQPTDFSNIHHRQSVLNPSIESFAISDISTTSIEPTQSTIPSSPTFNEDHSATFASGVEFNHPIVHSPSSNSLRADADHNTPNIVSRMPDRGLEHHWNSTLSTIPSLSERDSRSLARGSPSLRSRSQSQDSFSGNSRIIVLRKRGRTVGSTRSFSDNASSVNSEFSPVPLPLFSPASSPAQYHGDEKDHNGEHLDTISPLPSSGPIRGKASGYLRRPISDTGSIASSRPGSMTSSRPGSMTSSRPGSITSSRPGSSQSDMSVLITSNIPAWAKAYYQRGERISMPVTGSEYSGSIRPGTSNTGRTRTPSESNYAPNIYRPRNRPHDRNSGTDTISLADDRPPMEGDYFVLGPDGQMTRLSRFSTPHLRADNRAQRYSMWKAPSLDDDLGSTLFTRRNRQILLFCTGFIFPFAWMIAAVLPLPENPSVIETPNQAVIEQQIAQHLGSVDDKVYQKARWWRNLNRVMSGVGTLLIGVIIALVILITRMD